jgi:hypoxanthine-guanine phosphoribosyltransferase
VSVPDVVKNLAGESANDPKFKEAYTKAVAEAKKGNVDFVDAFVSTYQELNGKNKPIQADFVALTVPDRFVFGFGMDVSGHFRNLPACYDRKILS